jgi:uncharacterized protein (UPF0332 family)/predicted nucleotidyltransferase
LKRDGKFAKRLRTKNFKISAEKTKLDMIDSVKEFSERLLNSKAKDSILKVYLFGSYAKGSATKNSDIDLLVVTSDGLKVKDEIMDIAFEFQMDGVPLEPLICPVEELFIPQDYFIYNIMKNGEEVYSMKEEEIRKASSKGLKALAEEYLDSAINAKEQGLVRLSIDGAYNSAELAAKGLILLKTDDLPGSHGGTIGRFGELYIKQGLVEVSIGRRLNKALELRNFARYKFAVRLSLEDADSVIKLASSMIEVLTNELDV